MNKIYPILIDLLQIACRSIIEAEKYNWRHRTVTLQFFQQKNLNCHRHHQSTTTTTEYLVANASTIQLKIFRPCIEKAI